MAYLNDFGYNLSWGELDGGWGVRTGEQAMFRSDSRDEVEGFIMGLASNSAARGEWARSDSSKRDEAAVGVFRATSARWALAASLATH